MGNRPNVTLSVATSIDGYIDDTELDRLLLSNDADFDRVDEVRSKSDAILIGSGTMRADNPRLLVKDRNRRQRRMGEGRSEYPLKVAITQSGNLDPALKWFHHGGEKVVYTVDDVVGKVSEDLDGLAEVVSLGNGIDIERLLDDLGRKGVSRLMVEGGERVHTTFLASGFVNEIHLAVAPLLVGDGPRFVGRSKYPWPTTKRMNLLSLEKFGDVAVHRYELVE